MRRTFQLALPNGLFGDPLVVVRPRLLPRVLLLDAGDTTALSARTLLAVTDVFISHFHVDHAFGLGRLLRVRLGRVERPLRLHGPAGLVRRVRSCLDAFTWNLVDAFPLALDVVEVHGDRVERWEFPRESGFEPRLIASGPGPAEAPVLEDDLLAARALILDHGGIPCLAWRLDEHLALNVDAAALADAGLPTGPWLASLKDGIRAGAAADTPVQLPGAGAVPLGDLRVRLIRETPGDSVVYVTDVAPTDASLGALEAFAAGARRLILEAHFLDEDAPLARQHGHLTARIAGELAFRAAPAAVSPIHLSTRYVEREDAVLAELRCAAGAVAVERIPPAPASEDPA
jgi:ribonuclease Z